MYSLKDIHGTKKGQFKPMLNNLWSTHVRVWMEVVSHAFVITAVDGNEWSFTLPVPLRLWHEDLRHSLQRSGRSQRGNSVEESIWAFLAVNSDWPRGLPHSVECLGLIKDSWQTCADSRLLRKPSGGKTHFEFRTSKPISVRLLQ